MTFLLENVVTWKRNFVFFSTYRSFVKQIFQQALIILRIVELTILTHTATTRQRFRGGALSIPEGQRRSVQARNNKQNLKISDLRKETATHFNLFLVCLCLPAEEQIYSPVIHISRTVQAIVFDHSHILKSWISMKNILQKHPRGRGGGPADTAIKLQRLCWKR